MSACLKLSIECVSAESMLHGDTLLGSIRFHCVVLLANEKHWRVSAVRIRSASSDTDTLISLDNEESVIARDTASEPNPELYVCVRVCTVYECTLHLCSVSSLFAFGFVVMVKARERVMPMGVFTSTEIQTFVWRFCKNVLPHLWLFGFDIVCIRYLYKEPVNVCVSCCCSSETSRWLGLCDVKNKPFLKQWKTI